MSSENAIGFAPLLPIETPRFIISALQRPTFVSHSTNSTSQLPKSLLPAFSSTQCNQLPTPQSPSGFASYIGPDTSHSPSNQKSFTSFLSSETGHSKFTPDNNPSSSRMLTPDSSPVNAHWAPHHDRDPIRTWSVRLNIGGPSGALNGSPDSPPFHLPDSLSSESSAPAVNLNCPAPNPITTNVLTPSISPVSSRLSSPFAPRTPTSSSVPLQHRPPSPPDETLKMSGPSNPHTVTYNPIVTHSTTSSLIDPNTNLIPPAGGEMARIRQVTMENRMALQREAEMRRPDYLKREKRTGPSADYSGIDHATQLDLDKSVTIGVTNSPSKGRRLKLFQETSEESFEESLMAGGYGRYRTTEWVRQPQPLALAATNVAGPSNIVTLLEQAQEPPVSDRELKRRKRLEAFQRDNRSGAQKPDLLPAMMEGKGRVLVDATYEARTVTNDISLMKKRNVGRKKKNKDVLVKEDQHVVLGPVAEPQWPNWIDSEFPWRLRTEEIAGLQKVQEENRLKLIEKYLDRDSDDDDDKEDMDDVSAGMPDASHREQVQRLRGRGKMVPLSIRTHPADSRGPNVSSSSEKKLFPCDPADARIALLAKTSVRNMSNRVRRKRHTRGGGGVCICDNDTDDGRPLVQCDGCETWYHLQCIGIEDIAELGREEDPWFCHSCENRTSSSELDEILSSEPTFVPTDDEPQTHRTHDTPFFQSSSPYNSPSWSFGGIPRTPTHRGSDLDPPALSSGSSWINSSRHGPSTPQHPYGVHVYTQGIDTYGHPFEESPFDPASTPSRGIKFGTSFMTPKNSVWSARPSIVVQTPSKPNGRAPNRNGLAPFAGDANYKGGDCTSPLWRFSGLDESPIRRSRSGEGYQTRQYSESSLVSRTQAFPLLEESPIVRIKGKERM